ncbi:MAG: ABC transporter permease [Pseudobdellovibrionaceae bacterium]|nr:ABC transporter permease [Pseudobdellovibrionaceae bacterium]
MAREIMSRMVVTLELTALALLVGVIGGLLIGTLAADAIQGSWWQKHLALLSLLGISIPNFWLGTIFILWLSMMADLFPSGGFVAWSEDPVANLHHMVLPAASLGLAVLAVVSRMTQASIDSNIKQPYFMTALAKGLSRRQAIQRHILRPSLIPVVTVIGLQFASLLGGSIVVEELFSLPGMGRLKLQAVGNRNYPLLQGVLLMTGVIFITVNLLVDIAYGWLDPRIRRS